MEKKYFKCVRSCRLVGLNMDIESGQIFYKESDEDLKAKSFVAARNAGWIFEISQKEFDAIIAENKKKLAENPSPEQIRL